MKRGIPSLLILLLASVAAGSGYWLGFRHGSHLSLMADAVPRGAVAIGNLRLLEKGQTDSVRFYLESEVDTGLTSWNELGQAPLRPELNLLFGSDVVPGYETYVRKLALYRKGHPSPLDNPELTQQVLKQLQSGDPNYAQEFAEGDLKRRQAIHEMLQRYGQ
jgi:hypothetical protein